VNDAIPLNPLQRADLLYESQALESAHQSAAAEGDTAAPSADEKVDLHFVCFIKSEKNHLWEMDGRRTLLRGTKCLLKKSNYHLPPRWHFARLYQQALISFTSPFLRAFH
jgi:hypothetical protein